MMAMTVTVPTIILVIPLLLAVVWAWWMVATAFFNWLDPKVKGWLIRRYERKTGQKWDPEWSKFWDRSLRPLKGPWGKSD